MAKIHCILLVKNDEDVIELCLREASKWAHKIYIYDGARSDATWAIVQKMAIVGCGFVADPYAMTLKGHPELKLVGAFDTNEKNLAAFCRCWPVRKYASLQEILEDASVEMVLNLTNPRSHFEVTSRCLEAGKHVYSEKPLGMDIGEARKLVEQARQTGLYLASAPCNLLSETAQTMWKAMKDGVVGNVRLVYANFDDGLIAPKMSPWTWLNDCGVPWPAKDEFEVGCTYEHAGYVLTWLAAFFGPAQSVTAFSSCQIADKGMPVDQMAPDFSVGCIEYGGGVVARVTCGLVAPRDKSLAIIGDEEMIFTPDVRKDEGPVYVRHIPTRVRTGSLERRLNRLRVWLEKHLAVVPWSGHEWHFQRKIPFARKPSGLMAHPDKPVDFLRGPSEMAEAIRQKCSCRLSVDLGLHIVEIIEALQYPERFSGKRKIESTFDPIQPLPWDGVKT
jgi:predicted dehydrogenase